MHRKYALQMTLSIALIAVTLASVFAVIPVAKAADFEQFGPNVDQILIKLYANEQLEFAAFEAGEIDVVDWPLTKYWIDRWQTNSEIEMADYGGEIGAYEFDLNLNESMRASGPTGAIDGTYELSIAAQIPGYRHALAHLIDRAYIVSTIMQGFAVPLYGMIPPALGGYVNPAVVEMHPYNPTEAANILAAAGIVDSDSDGYLNWPAGMMGGANIELDFCVRDDHSPGRKDAGDRLIWELTTNLPGPKFIVHRWSAIGSVGARKWWMDGKSADIYTGGWSLTRDPDYMFGIWHSSMYWHPGRPPNSGHIHDPELDGYLEGIYYAQNFADAKTNTWEAQRVMAEKSLILGMYANSAPEAHRVNYTGGTNGAPVSPDDGENLYRGDTWVGFANMPGYGFNAAQSFFNAHPEGHELPASSANPMIVRYGFKVAEVNSLNPVYGEWVWDWEIMGKAYDSLYAINALDLSEDLENMADRWQTLVWDNAGTPATELVFEIRNDIYFHDGGHMTADDIIFTFTELVAATRARELPYPWYYSNLLDVNSIIVEGPYKVRIRMNSLSVFAFHWVGGNIVLPRHIWGPLFMGPDMIIGTADDETYDPETFAPDPGLIGQGPFKVYPHSIDKTDYYVPTAYAKMDIWTRYWGYGPDRKTGGIAQVCYNKPGYITLWKLNYHRYWVRSEEYTVIQLDDGTWWWWNETSAYGDTAPIIVESTAHRVKIEYPYDYSRTKKQWVQGAAPDLIWPYVPNPPANVPVEIDQKPPMTGTNPGVLLGNRPGEFLKLLPGVPDVSWNRVVKVVILERDACKGPNGVWDGGYPNGDDGPWYPERMFSTTKSGPLNEIEGDIDDNNVIDITDATMLSVQFGLRSWIWTEIDINSDGTINLGDASIVIRDWSV